MRNNTTGKRRCWKMLSATVGGVLLIAVAGCINITIKIGESQSKAWPPSPPEPPEPPPVGGNFVPVQAAPLGGGPATVCNNPISTTYVRFSNPYLTQIPDANVIGFRGTVVNTNTGAIIPNTDYYLQWFVNANPTNNACCTNLPGGTEVGCKIIPG